MDSDMASEILLAKECFLEKTFWPRSWNYSTEIRILNTQLITAPLFIFTSDWHIIKAVSATLLSLLLPLSLFFLLNQLGIKQLWIKLLSSLFIFCPWSGTMWGMTQFGNYYIPHITIAFFFIGIFFSLSYNDLSKRKLNFFIITLFFLAFTSGLAGIRYVLYFVFPLVAVYVSMSVNNLAKSGQQFEFKSFFVKDKPVFYSSMSLIICGLGYVINFIILQRFFLFCNYNGTKFTNIGDVTFSEVQNAIFGILGYSNGSHVFRPSGIINILIYVGIIFFLICIVKQLKNTTDKKSMFFTMFFIVMFIFNSFVITNTAFETRYFVLPVVFIVPCVSIFITNNHIGKIKRYILGVSFSVIFIGSAFLTFQNILSKTGYSRENVHHFLEKNNYKFGYGTFWNANVFSFLTDGEIEIANISDSDGFNSLEYRKWLVPNRYYTRNSSEKVFFIVSRNQYTNNADALVFKNGNLIYEDESYLIFDYADDKTFMESFGK
jgi:hypothetical protein